MVNDDVHFAVFSGVSGALAGATRAYRNHGRRSPTAATDWSARAGRCGSHGVAAVRSRPSSADASSLSLRSTPIITPAA